MAGALLLSVLPSQITGGLDPTEPQDDTCSPLDLSLVQSDHFDEIAESEIYQLMIVRDRSMLSFVFMMRCLAAD